MVLGGTVYSALDGPGGPILEGTTYSMTGRRQTRAKSITAGSCTKYAGSRVYTRVTALFFCLVCSNTVLAAKMKFSEFVQVAKNVIRHPLVLVLLLAAAVCVCLSIYPGTFIKSFTTSRQNISFLLEELAGQIPSHPPKVIHASAPAANGTEVPSLYPASHYKELCLIQGNAQGNYSHPEIVHYAYLSKSGRSPRLSFRQYLSVLSAHKFFKPKNILFHSNVAPSGKFWDLAVQVAGIEYNHVERVRDLGGRAPAWVRHEADFTKLSQVLLHGGVALDFDVVFLDGAKLREEQRKGECVLSGAKSCTLLNIGFFSCIKGARFLRDWREGYLKDYQPNLWLHNCAFYPTDLAKKKGVYEVVIDPDVAQYPNGVGSVKEWLGAGKRVEWRGKAAAHYFCRGHVKDGEEILHMQNSLGEMFRYIYSEAE